MTPAPRDVKPKRAYDSSRRRERAEQNRARVLDSAEQRFLRDGYVATTVASIAGDAGVSADTVFKAFGGKPGLVRAMRDRALAGEGSVPAERRSEALQAREADPRKIIQGWGRFVAELSPRASPILLLIRDAAITDPDVQSLLEEMDGDRLQRMTANARRLREAGHLRPGMTLQRAAEVLWTYSSPELYELLVMRRGWDADGYGNFVAEAMIAALL
jgi:AcrR family transcriptional regulator